MGSSTVADVADVAAARDGDGAYYFLASLSNCSVVCYRCFYAGDADSLSTVTALRRSVEIITTLHARVV